MTDTPKDIIVKIGITPSEAPFRITCLRTFLYINAIAEKESGDDFTPTCIKAGYLCTGIDKNGNIGTFDGLSIDMD